ncbi:MAG: ATP-binding protein [Clostridia bacterium]
MLLGSINEEIEKIENYAEQVLYYARSNNVEKDYIIKKVLLSDIINNVIKKNKKSLISKNISINIDNLNEYVNTDLKWIEYIINQIIINSIKYSKPDNNSINIFSNKNNDSISLHIKDSGIGIKSKNLSKVFDKGFTGENGRIIKESTGMGLYLCKKLCDKLNHNILINSNGIGVEVIIVFPINSFVENV